MSIWRVVLVAVVTMMMGFVGGVWFIGSGLGFRLIKVPAVPPVSAAGAMNPAAPRRPAAPARPKVEAVAVPAHWNISGGSGGLGRIAERGDLLPSPGCSWEVEPREFHLDNQWHRSNVERILIGVPSLDPKSRRLRYFLTQLTRPGVAQVALRVVLFDAAANRFPARATSPGRSSNRQEVVEYGQHDWDDLPPLDAPEKVFFGVERMVPDAARLAAEAARAEAQQKGVELMPPPRLGEPFPFDLATVDGKRVRSADLKGKAILLMFWGPFPRGPSSLAQIRKEFSAADLAVVGISFAGDPETARREFDQIGEPAPLVLVPNDAASRRLWREGVELPYLPAYWIIDRDGILRFREQWFDLPDRLATALGRPTRRGKFEAFVKESHAKAGAKAQPKAKGGSSSPPVAPTVALPRF